MLKIEPIARPPVVLSAKTRLELNVWEHELTAISRLKPDTEIIREMDPDYVDVDEKAAGTNVSKSVSSDVTTSDHHSHRSAAANDHRAHNSSKRFQREHRRTRSDNTRYFDPSALRRPVLPLPPSRPGKSAEPINPPPPKPDKKPRAPYSDVIVLPPPPRRPAPTCQLVFSNAAQPYSTHSSMYPMPTRACPPPPSTDYPQHGFRTSPPTGGYIQSRPIDYGRGSEWPYSRIPNPLEDMMSCHSNSPPQGDVFHSADNFIPRSGSSSSRRSQPPSKIRNRATYIYSDSGDYNPPFEESSSFPLRNPMEKLEFNSSYNLYPSQDGNEPTSPLNRRANTPPGTRYHEVIIFINV